MIDPKSELSRVCLRMTPPDCGKRVWFLDLGRPAFGMSPLRLIGDRPLAIEAAQIADNVVAALLDINENQIYQSSRRYLNHAVIGAIAIATKQGRRARLEDVYTLLRPAKDEFRSAVAEACADQPDLDQTAEFYRSELPDDLRMATSRVAERLDAPRNKISGLTGVPPLRRFFNHPTDVPLREIVQARDILIVDANMGAIGTENSKACMLFILRMLHAQLQRQVHLPEAERPRVPLLVDEAHYVASGENVVDQIATHRAAGLEAAFGLQYFAQLGSASEHQQKILKGVLNLLQSRFLFRMGDAEDAEQATRIAMAVYATMIRDDPDSRARLRVTPEQALNFPNYYCLASWIANGTRAPSFMGQTYPLPDVGRRMGRRSTSPLKTSASARIPSSSSRRSQPTRSRRTTSGAGQTERRATSRRQSTHPRNRCLRRTENSEPTAAQPVKHEVQVDYEPPSDDAAGLADSPVRRLVGRPRSQDAIAKEAVDDHELPLSDTLRELDVPRPDQRDRARRPARRRQQLAEAVRRGLRDPRAARPRRARATQPDRPRRATGPRDPQRQRPADQALPPRPDRPPQHRPARTHTHRRQSAGALLADAPWARKSPRGARQRRRSPPSANGGRSSSRAPAGSRTTCTRSVGRSSSTATVGELATDRWRTPRYATGRYPVPQVGSGQRRHPITIARDQGPRRPGDHRPRAEDVHRDQARPLARAPLRTAQAHLRPARRDRPHRAALLQPREVPRLRRVPLRLGLAHPRYRAQGTRPAVVFVSPNQHAALACAREADELLTGRIGVMGTPAEHWYYAGRDHLFFAVEEDIHHGDAVGAGAASATPRATRAPQRSSGSLARAGEPGTASVADDG